jgi:hypothetical protein
MQEKTQYEEIRLKWRKSGMSSGRHDGLGRGVGGSDVATFLNTRGNRTGHGTKIMRIPNDPSVTPGQIFNSQDRLIFIQRPCIITSGATETSQAFTTAAAAAAHNLSFNEILLY